MSHVVVFNSAAKTFKILTQPTTYLTEVRDEACKKFNVSKDQFTLKYNNKPISLSQQIRLANLPQGARLELIQSSRSPTVISVALQLPATENNARLTQKFASNTSLWEILRQFESGQGAKYNFTQRGVPEMSSNGTSRAERLNYEMPIITVMPGHREQSEFIGLQQTLSQLGFDSGSALLKLSFKNSGTPLEEAMSQISQYFKASEVSAASTAGAHSTSVTQSNSIPDVDKAASEAVRTVAGDTVRVEEPDAVSPELSSMDVDSEPNRAPPFLSSSPRQSQAEDIAPVASSSETLTDTSVRSQPALTPSSSQATSHVTPRRIQIFSAPTSSTPQAARSTFNESDYIPTIEHAKSHQAALQAKSRNTRLLSDRELAEEAAVREGKLVAAAEKGGSLRVRMPDQTIVQLDISKADTANLLYELVEGFLEFSDQPFQLKYVGPTGRQVLIARDRKRLMQDLRFSPRETVTFLWDQNASDEARLSRKTLKKEWADKAQKLEVYEQGFAAGEKEEPKVEAGKMVGEGKKRELSAGEKDSKLKNILAKGLFKKR